MTTTSEEREREVQVMTERLTAILETCDDSYWQTGTYWYASAHNAAAHLAVTYHTTVRHACGVIAALSPRLPWARNIMYAAQLLETGDAPVLSANKQKARRIAAGEEPLDVLSGSKVRAFYLNMVQPGYGDDVCVDRHAVDAAIGLKGSDETRKRILERKGGYQLVADAYRVAAARFAIAPAQAQAIVWLVWKNAHGGERS